MAFRRKDVKKSSYYLWFLGAKESTGLRGEEYIVPVLEYLVNKERDVEPSKVTLQVSSKGLKIIQNMPKKQSKSQASFLNLNSKTEQIKHVIPHHAITCAYQKDDIVSTILLIYNPVTKCPVHVHAYRCDTVETASSLYNQLNLIVDRPENQKKFQEIERRLVIKGINENKYLNKQIQQKHHPLANQISDDSSLSIEDYKKTTAFYFDTSINKKVSLDNKSHDNPEVAILYESLAAELKAKLNNPKEGPLLLPPKDYDLVPTTNDFDLQIKNKNKILDKNVNSNLIEIKNEKIKAKTQSESSGKSSSGIGSDEPLRSLQEIQPDYSYKLDAHSSDDELNCIPIRRNESFLQKMIQKNDDCTIPLPIVPKSRSALLLSSSSPVSKSIVKAKFFSPLSSSSSSSLASTPPPLTTSTTSCTRKKINEINNLHELNKETPHYYFPNTGFNETSYNPENGYNKNKNFNINNKINNIYNISNINTNTLNSNNNNNCNKNNNNNHKLKRHNSNFEYFNQFDKNNVVKKTFDRSISLNNNNNQVNVNNHTKLCHYDDDIKKPFSYLSTKPIPFRFNNKYL